VRQQVLLAAPVRAYIEVTAGYHTFVLALPSRRIFHLARDGRDRREYRTFDASPVNAWPAERFDRAGFPLSFHRAAQSRIGSRLACLPSPLGRARSCSDAKSGSLWTEDGSRPRRGRVSPREDTNLTPASVSQRKRRRCSDIDLAQA